MIKKTKIIATIGPSSNHQSIIAQLIRKGMNIARINMAHQFDEDSLNKLIEDIRAQSVKVNKYVGILMDIAGPKIRVDLSNIGNEEIEIIKNHVYQMGYSKINDIPLNLNVKFNDKENEKALVKIDDGKISFKVISIRNNVLKIKALNSGLITSNKGVNFPNVNLDIPSITNKDKKDIKLGIKLGIDWFALSFVRNSNDIKPFLNIFKNQKKFIPVIAKIEKPEAITNLNDIIEKFNGLLIARGDLGVEMSLAKLPVLQKKIIHECKKSKKPVIVATQILESMIQNSIPTRAEVNDVASSVYEEVDAVMLSGETAIGEYPVESVSIMSEIIKDVEYEMSSSKINEISIVSDSDNRSAIGDAVNTISKHLKVDAIVVMTESGATARVVSHYRPSVNIYGLSPFKYICNRMSLLWGVTPIKTDNFLTTDDMLKNIENILVKSGYLKNGQTFIFTAGIPLGVSGSTNMLKIHKVHTK